MIIGIDIRVLAKGARTGVEEYAINLLSRLVNLKSENKYRFFYNAFRKPELDFNWLKGKNAEIFDFKIPNRFVFDPSARLFNFPKVDRLLGGVDVFFSPHFLLTPLGKNCKRVLTIHDLSFSRYPEFFSFSKLLWHKSLGIKKQVLAAERLIVPSRSTKADLANFYGLPEEKISVIPHGVSPEFRPVAKNGAASLDFKKKHNLPDRFILHLGTIEPRKNIVGLVKAFELLKSEKENADLGLVLAGSLGWLYADALSAVENSKFRSDIRILSSVSSEERPLVYNLAEIFVCPSFFEGFGLPVLEAMACGTPVIASNNSSLPEVLGNAGFLVDPYRPEDIYLAAKEILESGALRENFVQRGILRAKNFSWEKCAKETMEILSEAVN